MRDIETRADVEFLLSEFYKVATLDERIGHHFDDLDLAAHLPVFSASPSISEILCGFIK